MVIRELEGEGPDSHRLEALRMTAPLARDALYNADFNALGRAMIRNTLAQRDLHPGLVSKQADKVIDIAHAHGALGWKVNGAGGEGGSLTLLCGERSEAKRAMLREIQQAHPGYREIPVYLSRFGLRTWKVDNPSGPLDTDRMGRRAAAK
jgi:D-glycero-alpha-D-manno-heptose-7-phosphate kinase